MSSSSTSSSTTSSTTSSDPEEDESNTSEGEQMFMEIIALQMQIEKESANISRRRQRKKRRHRTEMESVKREGPMMIEPEAKKARVDEVPASVRPEMKQRVVLNPADCDLDFNIEGNGLQGSGLFENGFAYCWSGARANVGIRGGRYCFSCTIISAQPVDMDDTPIDQQHVCRLGISRGDDKVGNLGETVHSFGFGGTGKFSNAGKFVDYGEKYEVGDTILCAVNLESKPLASISFAKNGKWLGTARQFNAGPYGFGVVDSSIRELHWESAVFPHILLKNVVVRLQFSFEDGLVPEEGYKPWASALEDGNAIIGPVFQDLRECEVMMMVGLPASGKSTWAEKWVNEHPEKRYVLLGTNLALDQMKVPGLQRKQNYCERFDRLMDRATGIFNTLLSRASRTPRNFIIDQTNVYKSARKRKLKPFANCQKIAVVVFPKPEELKFRGEKRFREMGKEVPAEAVNEMLANFVLPKSKDMPGTDEYFDQVIFVELNRAESQTCLDEMKASQKSSLSPFSRESSVQSYKSPAMQYSGEKTIQHYQCLPVQYCHENYFQSYKGTPVQYSHGSSAHEYNNPSLLYQGPSSGGHRQSSYPSQLRLTAPCGNDSSTGSFLPRDDFNHRRSYSAYDQSWRSQNETRTAAAVGVSDPYRSNSAYGVSNNLFPPENRSSSSFPGTMDYKDSCLGEPYAITSSSYNTYGGHIIPGGHQVHLPAPRPPTFLPPRSEQYGSPYGTSHPRPSYGNYPMNPPQSGGYAPPPYPGPGYY